MIDLTDTPVSALLELHGDVLSELRRRNIVRSANNPTGDYGELLFRAHSAGRSTAILGRRRCRRCRGAALPDQVQAAWTPQGSRQLGFIRRLPDRPFDRLAAVLLDNRFRVIRAAISPTRSSSRALPMSIASRRGNSCCGIRSEAAGRCGRNRRAASRRNGSLTLRRVSEPSNAPR